MKYALLLYALLFTACSTKNETRVVWHPTSAENVRVICQNTNAGGCAQMDPSGCTIITPPMPLEEFTGANYDMQSPLWRELAHELMHCFGYDHEPTPK